MRITKNFSKLLSVRCLVPYLRFHIFIDYLSSSNHLSMNLHLVFTQQKSGPLYFPLKSNKKWSFYFLKVIWSVTKQNPAFIFSLATSAYCEILRPVFAINFLRLCQSYSILISAVSEQRPAFSKIVLTQYYWCKVESNQLPLTCLSEDRRLPTFCVCSRQFRLFENC